MLNDEASKNDLPAAIAEELAMLRKKVAMYEDTTERIRENDDLLRIITDSLPVIISVINMDGTYRLCSGRGLRDLGKTSDDYVGKSVWDVYRDNESMQHNLQRAFQGKNGESLDTTDKAAVENLFTPFYNDQGQQIGVIIVSTDVTERIQGEQDRASLQEQIINAQDALLRELSTPLIPLVNDVVVMPIIGAIDSRRSQMMLETLLQGVAQNQAQTVILDITGVPLVDTQVANVLIQAAQSVKLLGAQVILTGIRPEVAQTLVSLGTNLADIRTQNNLQSAITSVLRRYNRN